MDHPYAEKKDASLPPRPARPRDVRSRPTQSVSHRRERVRRKKRNDLREDVRLLVVSHRRNVRHRRRESLRSRPDRGHRERERGSVLEGHSERPCQRRGDMAGVDQRLRLAVHCVCQVSTALYWLRFAALRGVGSHEGGMDCLGGGKSICPGGEFRERTVFELSGLG